MELETRKSIVAVLETLNESSGELLDRVKAASSENDMAEIGKNGMIAGIEACRGLISASVEFWDSKQ